MGQFHNDEAELLFLGLQFGLVVIVVLCLLFPAELT